MVDTVVYNLSDEPPQAPFLKGDVRQGGGQGDLSQQDISENPQSRASTAPLQRSFQDAWIVVDRVEVDTADISQLDRLSQSVSTAFEHGEEVVGIIDFNDKKVQSTKYKVQNDWEEIIIQLQKQVEKENIAGRDINNALMDFGAIASISYNQTDVVDYPLPGCKWFQTEGKLEIKKVVPKKQRTKKTYFCLVFLHENHMKYWSSAT